MKQYWPWILGTLGSIIGLAVLYFQAKIRIGEMRAASAIKTDATPIEVLRQELSARTAESRQIHAEFIAYVQAQTRAMNEMGNAVKAHTDLLQAHMTASSDRAGKIYDKIHAVNERLAIVDARLDS